MKTSTTLLLMMTLTIIMAKAQTVNFDDTQPDEVPLGWTATKTAQGEPEWTVVADNSTPSKPNALRQSGEADYSVTFKNDTKLKDGFVEVKFKLASGK